MMAGVSTVEKGEGSKTNNSYSTIHYNETGKDRENAIWVDNYDFDGVSVVEEVISKVKNEPSSSKDGKRQRRRGFSGQPVIYVDDSPDPTSFCSICLEPKSLSESLGMSACSHAFCIDCVRQYVAVKIQENASTIRCPSPDCKDGFLEPAMCMHVLPPEVFERWCSILSESLVLGFSSFYCPFKDCSAPLIYETSSESGGEVIRESECPYCWRLFCAQCKVPWHAELSCGQFQELAPDERDNDDIKLKNLAKKNNWQRCPKCKFFVERIEGCKFMSCRCGHTFCYTCGTKMTKDHYCTICKG